MKKQRAGKSGGREKTGGAKGMEMLTSQRKGGKVKGAKKTVEHKRPTCKRKGRTGGETIPFRETWFFQREGPDGGGNNAHKRSDEKTKTVEGITRPTRQKINAKLDAKNQKKHGGLGGVSGGRR